MDCLVREAVTCIAQLTRSGGNMQNLWFLYKNMVHGIAELMAQLLGKATSFGKVTIMLLARRFKAGRLISIAHRTDLLWADPIGLSHWS